MNVKKRAECRLLGTGTNRFKLLARMGVAIQIINLSTGGACISCKEGLYSSALGEDSRVQLMIPCCEESITVTARVMWVEKTDGEIRAGLSFETIDPEQYQKLVDLLNAELRFAKGD